MSFNPETLQVLACNQVLFNYFLHGAYGDILNRVNIYINFKYRDALTLANCNMRLSDLIDLLNIVNEHTFLWYVKYIIERKYIFCLTEEDMIWPIIKLLKTRGYLPPDKPPPKKKN